jgi:hypothetical protein
MLVNMPQGRIVGDECQPYLCISNAHDGSLALQVSLTGIRVICSNTLSAALHIANRKLSIRHKKEVLRTMGAASKYFHDLEIFASELAWEKVNIAKVLDTLSYTSSANTLRAVRHPAGLPGGGIFKENKKTRLPRMQGGFLTRIFRREGYPSTCSVAPKS